MRKFFGHLTTLIAVAVAALIGYFALVNWQQPTPIKLTTPDGRPLISAAQPVIAEWDGVFDNNSGYDISYPQCKQGNPDGPVGFAIIGLNKGKPFSDNPCFGSQWQWARSLDGAAVYINLADPNKSEPAKYGAKIASDTLKRLKKGDVPQGTPIWLDIETHNTWTTPDRSTVVINEVAARLTKAGYPVGVYAPPVHWFEITLNAVVELPVWLALGPYDTVQAGVDAAKLACTNVAFGDASPEIVQFVTESNGTALDHNLMCEPDPVGLIAQN